MKRKLLALSMLVALGAPVAQAVEIEPVLGAIAGAAIGNQFGQGNGKTAATAIGAVIGYEMGERQAEARRPFGYTYEQRREVYVQPQPRGCYIDQWGNTVCCTGCYQPAPQIVYAPPPPVIIYQQPSYPTYHGGSLRRW